MPNTILKIPLISTLIASTALNCSKPSLIHSYGRRRRHICHCSSAASVSQRIRSPQLVALEYADLSIPHIVCEEFSATRVRQHVNPLSSNLSIPVEAPNWNDVFEDPKLPLVVDIGSGSGRYLMWLAKRNPGTKNYMGLDIRKKLITRAEIWAKELGLNNIHFLFANASISFKQIISTYPGPLMLVSILCPDPHFKKRHHKRRIVQKPLVEAIVDGLMPGGQVFIQSDVLDVSIDMRKYFDSESEKLVHIDKFDSSLLCDDEGWLVSNPMGIRTEREIHAEFEGAKIYRRMYQKISVKIMGLVYNNNEDNGFGFANGGGQYPPHQHGGYISLGYAYPAEGYPQTGYPHPPAGYPSHNGYPAHVYPSSSGHGMGSHGYGAHQVSHGHGFHGYGGYGQHHGTFNHGNYNKHGGKFGNRKMWK